MNLVPTCRDCNDKKSAAYAQAGIGFFLHAYLDTIPRRVRFLYAEVCVQDGTVVVAFCVRPPKSLDVALRQRIVTHYQKLNLTTLYQSEAVNEICERRGHIKNMIDNGVSIRGVSKYLRQDARSIALVKGRNYWRYALLDAMARDSNICEGAFE